jgi:hypothetical protein
MSATPQATLLKDPHGYYTQQLITNQVLYQLSYTGVSQIPL